MEFDQLPADAESHAVHQLDGLGDAQVHAIQRAQVFDQEPGAVVREFQVPDGHAPQARDVGAIRGAADVPAIGMDGPQVGPLAARVEDLQGE